MKKYFASTITIAILSATLSATSASAQLLGGSGGLGGALGSGLSNDIGTDTIGRTTGTLSGRGGITNSTRLDRTIDTRSGRVAADADSSSSANGSLLGAADLPSSAANGSANGSASGSAKGGTDTTLLGTDAIRGTTSQATGTARNMARNTIGRAQSTAGNVASTARSTAANAVNSASAARTIAGNAAGNGSAMAMGELGQLAGAGSAAAQADGMFAVTPGMPIEDPKGRVIGYVQSVQQTGSGIVRSVIVETGNRTATLPAANFAGSGDVLVTAMSKGEVKQAAEEQEQAPQGESNQ